MNTVASRWIDLMLALNGVKLNVIGREHLSEPRPAVFIFNHRNNFDALIVARLVEHNFTGVAKKEMANNPFAAVLGKLADVAFIDRADSATAVASLQAIPELAKKGMSILIAPEGTRLDTSEVGPFKKGAFRIAMAGGIPLVPIVIRNAELDRGTRRRGAEPRHRRHRGAPADLRRRLEPRRPRRADRRGAPTVSHDAARLAGVSLAESARRAA